MTPSWSSPSSTSTTTPGSPRSTCCRRASRTCYKAARELWVELETRCGESQELKPYRRTLLTSSALSAGQARDCATFHELMARFVSLGGSQGDVAGYLKNYVPHCQQQADGATP